VLLALAMGLACAGTVEPVAPPVAPSAPAATRPSAAPPQASAPDVRTQIVRSAEAMLGAPYRYGGSTPRGFDCSGLVLYSYARAGVDGLPRSARDLEARSDTIRLTELRPADLLFFRLDGRKTKHVGIYTGNRQFIHAPSPGKRVERVSFDHVYWGQRLQRAGRLLP